MDSVWTKIWSKDGLLPPLEYNQGLLTLLALVLVLVAFAVQSGRARKAEARASRLERDRKRDAEAAEEARRQEAEAARTREQAAAGLAERTTRANQMRQFVGVASGILDGVRINLLTDQQKADANRELDLPRPTQAVKRQAAVAASSLAAILPAAPMHPAVIVSTREAGLVLEILANTPSVSGEKGDEVTVEFVRHLSGALMTLARHQQILLAELGMSDAGADVQTEAAPPTPTVVASRPP